jgi:fatty-acyl-CoA synthase
VLVTWNGRGFSEWSWDDWRGRSLRIAGGLQHLGVGAGDRVGCLLTNSSDACAAVLGVWLAGACLVSVPVISRGMALARYADQLRTICAQAELALLLCDASVASVVEAADLRVPVVPFQRLNGRPRAEQEPPKADAPLLIQYSSGSTTEPRGCVLTTHAVAHQLAALQTALSIDAEADTGVAWLPLSHDMGLIGCLLLSYWAGHRLVLGTPERFTAQPASWFEDCARFGATLSAAPNFALEIASRVAAARLPPPCPMQRLIIGGERVEGDTLTKARAILGVERLPSEAVVPGYGLAEATLAVTMSPLRRPPRMIEVDSEALELGSIVAGPTHPGQRTTTFVSLGNPITGCQVQVPDGEVGSVLVESASLAEGYLSDPVQTAERFTPAGLVTGDLGFALDGELFITGRADDLMCVAGRNVYARDLERAFARVSTVRPGACTAVDVGGGDGNRLVAVVEPKAHHPDFSLIAEELALAARRALGVRIDGCVFFERGTLPKTPSGKVRRFLCQELVSAGAGVTIELRGTSRRRSRAGRRC